MLHDARSFRVIPRRDGDGPLIAQPVPVVLDSGYADPATGDRYYIEAIRLWTV